MTVHGGPSFREWQLGRATGPRRLMVMMRWWVRDHPAPLVIRSGARSREDQQRLLRNRIQYELLVHQRQVMVLGPSAKFTAYTS